MRDISSNDDMVDVRDLIERFEELETEHEDLVDALDSARENMEAIEEGDEALEEAKEEFKEKEEELKTWEEENGEFKELKELLEDLCGNGGDHQWRGDWYPSSLINDSYFTEAMQDLVVDIGDLPKDIPSYLEIDWEKTANNLQQDYSSVEWEGTTFWYR
jgi:hypothetical protein